MAIYLRDAEEADIPIILSLVQQLAVHEDQLDHCHLTEDLIRKNLVDNDFARCTIAFTDQEDAVGIALYYFNYSSWTGKRGIYLEDLFVKESCRGQNIAKRLFGYIYEVAKENDCPRIDFVVSKTNVKSFAYYKKLGAEVQSQWHLMRFEGEALDNFSSWSPATIQENCATEAKTVNGSSIKLNGVH